MAGGVHDGHATDQMLPTVRFVSAGDAAMPVSKVSKVAPAVPKECWSDQAPDSTPEVERSSGRSSPAPARGSHQSQDSPQGDVNATKVRTSSLKDRNRGRRSSLQEGREQRSLARAKAKKKLPNGFALQERMENKVTARRRISQIAAQEQHSRWTRARLWLLPVVRHKYFNLFAAIVIMANALFMGVETSYISCSGDVEGIEWYVANVCFTQLFVVELTLRWFVEGLPFWFDPWNIFDALLVLFSLFDDFVLAFLLSDTSQSQNLKVVFRIARMIRFVRVLRLLRLFKGLWYLVEGIVASLSSLAWAWLLLIVMMYLPAIFVTQTFGRDVNADAKTLEYFGSLPQSMYTLFKVMTMETWADIARHTARLYPGAEIFFVLYIFCTSALACGQLWQTVRNVVVAVIVQNTCAWARQLELLCLSLAGVHAKERQEDMRSFQEKKDASAMLKILEVFQTADVQNTGSVTKKEFLEAMNIPSVMQLMHEAVQIDVRQVETLFDVLDYNSSGTLDSEEFVEAGHRDAVKGQEQAWFLLCSTTFGSLVCQDEHDTIKTLEQLEDEIGEAFDGMNRLIETFHANLLSARGATAEHAEHIVTGSDH
ncbi:Cacna1c [Symbiodinium sp. CCMP2592]|nr:Cacna1c [Symbiodinium sp. CCMP2592]